MSEYCYYKQPQNKNITKYLNDVYRNGKKLAILKVETTGLDAETDEICGIRIMLCEANSVSPEDIGTLSCCKIYKTLIKTTQPIPMDVTKISGITNEMIQNNGIELKDALLQINELISGAYICGFNMKKFLYPFLFGAMKRNGIQCAALGGFDIIDLASITVAPKDDAMTSGYNWHELTKLFGLKQNPDKSWPILVDQLYKRLPTGTKTIPDNFIVSYKIDTYNGHKYIIFKTQDNIICLNCWTEQFEVPNVILDTYNMDQFIGYLFKKTKENTVHGIIEKLTKVA